MSKIKRTTSTAKPARVAKRTEFPGQASVFAALGDEVRLRLIATLCVGGAMSITQLTEGTAITRQAVTKHLDVLAAAGLAKDAKVGRERLWEFQPAPLDQARRSLEAIGRSWDRALARLKAALEG